VKRVTALSCLLAIATLPAGAVERAAGEPAAEWNFSVYLDDRPIGYHRFRLHPDDGEFELRSEARLRVRILGIPVYRYTHSSEETWHGGCLQQIRAQTDDNGESHAVQGRKDSDAFLLSTPQGSRSLDGCVRSFAYWNPRLLGTANLLNPQTGEYVQSRFEHEGSERLELGERTVDAERYRLSADDAEIHLWYDAEDRWLALESVTRGARLRYVLQ
jgi:hypothetical protein